MLFLRQSLQMLQKVSKMLHPEIIFEILQKSDKKLLVKQKFAVTFATLEWAEQMTTFQLPT